MRETIRARFNTEVVLGPLEAGPYVLSKRPEVPTFSPASLPITRSSKPDVSLLGYCRRLKVKQAVDSYVKELRWFHELLGRWRMPDIPPYNINSDRPATIELYSELLQRRARAQQILECMQSLDFLTSEQDAGSLFWDRLDASLVPAENDMSAYVHKARQLMQTIRCTYELLVQEDCDLVHIHDLVCHIGEHSMLRNGYTQLCR